MFLLIWMSVWRGERGEASRNARTGKAAAKEAREVANAGKRQQSTVEIEGIEECNFFRDRERKKGADDRAQSAISI